MRLEIHERREQGEEGSKYSVLAEQHTADHSRGQGQGFILLSIPLLQRRLGKVFSYRRLKGAPFLFVRYLRRAEAEESGKFVAC